jgi:hypothetical protein
VWRPITAGGARVQSQPGAPNHKPAGGKRKKQTNKTATILALAGNIATARTQAHLLQSISA